MKWSPDKDVRCHSCGKGVMRPDLYRKGAERKRIHSERCECGRVHMRDGYPYHRRGSGACIHNPRNTDPALDPPF